MAPTTTSPASAASCRSEQFAVGADAAIGAGATRGTCVRRGFTLVEMLIVIGLLVLLTAILLPMLSKISRQAQRYKIGALMNTIGAGLEAYKADFGDYPRPPEPTPLSTQAIEQSDGFAILGVALVGPGPASGYPNVLNNGTLEANAPLQETPQFASGTPYPAGTVVQTPGAGSLSGQAAFYVCINEMGSGTSSALTDTTHWSPFQCWADGADEPGFRQRPAVTEFNGGTVGTQGSGRTWGPYIQTDHIKMVGAAIVDPYNHPILYFARTTSSVNINAYQPIPQNSANSSLAAGGYVASWPPTTGAAATGGTYPPPMYNFSDNGQFCHPLALGGPGDTMTPDARPMQALLGIGQNNTSAFTAAKDPTTSSAVTNGDTPAWTGPYILWSPGTSSLALYGPNWLATPSGYNDPTSYTDPTPLHLAVSKGDNVFNFSFAR